MKLILDYGLPPGSSASDRASFMSKVFEGDPVAPRLEEAARSGILREEQFDLNVQSGNITVVNKLLTGRLTQQQRNRAVTARNLILESGAGEFAASSIDHLVGHPMLGTRAESIIDLSETNPARAAELAQALLVDESKIDPEDLITIAETKKQIKKEEDRILAEGKKLAGEKKGIKPVGESRIDEFNREFSSLISRIRAPIDVFAEKLETFARKGAETDEKINRQLRDVLESDVSNFADNLGIDTTIAGIDSTVIDAIEAGGKVEDAGSILDALNVLKEKFRK